MQENQLEFEKKMNDLCNTGFILVFFIFTLKAFVKTSSSFEELIKMWPAVEYPFKGIVVAKLQIRAET